ncbi:MAG: hypothetical protein M5U13_12480 [Thermoanaerobaculia bacterium]|nr:hypothetical protein [Thermoanaerobaculia bacterium]
MPDRWALGRAAWRIAAASHREQTEERLAPWQRQTFLDFARRYARVEGRLVPGLFEWLVAGRGVADDNFAWELFDVLQSYPWQEREAEIPTVRVDGDELDLGTRRLRFRLRFRRTKRRPVALPVRRRPRPDDPDDWLRAFEGGGLCSYPPEDLVVEEYGRHLATRARSLLAAERSRSEPFVASLLDGVDLRETLRHRADDGRVWVHERGRAPGAAGAVVVIFDRDRPHGGAERFPFRMTWHGEHHQESDMAFYATDPGAQVVGPGILRATYGGFLLTHPPGRLWDPWRDPDYGFAREKTEVLLAAGIDYSLERLVVYVAPQPPPPASPATPPARPSASSISPSAPSPPPPCARSASSTSSPAATRGGSRRSTSGEGGRGRAHPLRCPTNAGVGAGSRGSLLGERARCVESAGDFLGREVHDLSPQRLRVATLQCQTQCIAARTDGTRVSFEGCHE